MKRADKRTDYVLLEARTGSEWDCCAFVVIKITDGWLRQLQERYDRLEPFKDDLSFSGHSYFDSPEGYYNPPDGWEVDELLEQGEVWTFVETDEEELSRLPVPENALDTHMMVLDKYGNARFTAYGKYTGEEFFTEDFNVMHILKGSSHDTGN